MAGAAQPLAHIAAHLAQADQPELHEGTFPLRLVCGTSIPTLVLRVVRATGPRREYAVWLSW
ncbi:hypothetical protein GCM10009811_36080 [Nostocoides veronense]|uniref:Uncharacterized protein n=1 Tax=Nostocoides veronense TaxID=330836 RepID=A0ABP4YD09_9MICO